MFLIYYLYSLTKINRLGRYRGFWRIRKLLQKSILTRNTYFRAPYLGHSIFVCPNHSMGRKIFEGGVYEPAIIRTVQTFSNHGYSFIDIGANIGLHTLAAALSRKNSGQMFISFEPNQDIFSILRKNCRINNLDFVILKQEGVGEIETSLPLNISVTRNMGRNSFLPLDNTNPGQLTKIVTLDNLFLYDKKMNSRSILIKIDTEGYELPILKGGSQWFSRTKDLAIICEISPKIMESNQMAVNDIFAITKGCGLNNFRLFRDQETVSDLANSNQYNILFYKGAIEKEIIPLIENFI